MYKTKGTGNKYVVLQLETLNARAPLSEQKSGESRERLQITLSQSLSFSLPLLTFSHEMRGSVCV